MHLCSVPPHSPSPAPASFNPATSVIKLQLCKEAGCLVWFLFSQVSPQCIFKSRGLPRGWWGRRAVPSHAGGSRGGRAALSTAAPSHPARLLVHPGPGALGRAALQPGVKEKISLNQKSSPLHTCGRASRRAAQRWCWLRWSRAPGSKTSASSH